MDVLPFFGCVIPNRLPFLEKSAKLVFKDLGINFIEVPFSCCPDPVGIAAVSEKAWVTLGARNLSIAEKENKKIVSFCNGCAETLIGVKHYIEHNKEEFEEIREILKKKGYNYKGTAEINHFVRYLIEGIGIEKIKKCVKNPLNGLKVATHTGCHYARPSDWIQWDDPLNPKCLDELVKAIGAEAINYTEKTLCCGAAVDRVNSKIALEIAKRKFQSITESGAQCIALNCPACFQQFDNIQKNVNKEFGTNFQIPIFYITELMAIAFGHSPEELGFKFHSTKLKSIFPDS